jgi:hypothetical protein
MNAKNAKPARKTEGSRRAVPSRAAAPNALSLLSPQLGFVVQFRGGAGLEPGSFSGRVEHLVSGQVDHFSDVAELLGFLERVLVETQTT